MTNTLESGFNKFVLKTHEGCWGWKGCCPSNPGYGQFRVKMKKYRAHIASWLLHCGTIPEGMCVLHKCDNPRCSNPDHLFLGTKCDNMRDAIEKGRHPTLGKIGEKNHQAVLTRQAVLTIKMLFNIGYTVHDVARIFNIHPSTIGNIKYNVTWRELQ